jgi:hypothetical protein
MALLNRQQLLKKETLQIERVDLNETDFVFVRQMTGRERDRFEQSLFKESKDKKGNITYVRSLEDFRAKLVVNTVCDEQGNNLLEPTDVETLSSHMSAATLEKIITKSQELNKITESDKDAMVKNSVAGQIEGDTSESAGPLEVLPIPTNGSTD